MIIGAGGVGRVVAFKCAQNKDVFSEILLAGRTVSKCVKIAEDIKIQLGYQAISTAAVDAENIPELVHLINRFKPKMILNMALPYQDLTIMEACLQTGVHYLDTANYEPREEAKFEYSWQWAYKDRFKQANLTAILGCGFDPGVTGVFTAYAAKHYFDEIKYLDIIDANAGNHGKAFATNFNPEINIREVTQKGKFWENGQWIFTEPHEIKRDIYYPNIGPKTSYLIYHEELESLVLNFPTIKRARFWMTFSEEYLTHLRVIQNIGMGSIEPVMFQGREIIPLEFLKAVLPDPGELGENYTGQTSIGVRIRGKKEDKWVNYYIWNNCQHADAFRETGTQGVSYTTGVPAMVGAKMFLTDQWSKPGVFNVEEFNPDPFLKELGASGLPWNEQINGDLEFEYPE
jgi:saccharopine dehydrogenase (NAD+, L-lysine-forming)